MSDARRFPWGFAALVVAVAVLAAFVPIAVVAGRAAWAHRGQRDIRRQVDCAGNLDELVRAYVQRRDGGRLDPTLHGSAQILSWFGEHGRPSGEETIILCPADPDVLDPGADDDRRADQARAERVPVARGLGSYAVRDFERFPVDRASTEQQPILCDRQGDDGSTPHHKNSIVIAFDSGKVQMYSREQLGLGPDDPIVVGPDSPTPLLRVFERP